MRDELVYNPFIASQSLATTPGEFKTLSGIIVPAGVRVAVTRVHLGTLNPPLDRQIAVRLIRAGSLGEGSIVFPSQLARNDPDGRDSLCSYAASYGSEPGSLDPYPGWLATFSDLGKGIDHYFQNEDEQFKCVGGAGITLCLQAAPMNTTAEPSVVIGHWRFREY